MNQGQKTTKSGKPIINRNTKLPEYNKSVHNRSNGVKQQLGINTNRATRTHEDIWKSIQLETKLLIN